jgi:hypothetical protein
VEISAMSIDKKNDNLNRTESESYLHGIIYGCNFS